MGALAAEEPHGLGIVHHDSKDGNLALGCAGGDGLVCREDALGAGVDFIDGRARMIEVGLGEGVVTSKELELNHCSDLSFDLFRPKLEAHGLVDGITADRDDLDVDGCVLSC